MKRVIAIFLLLVAGLSVGLWLKVREAEEVRSGLPGSSGVIEGVESEIAARIASRIASIEAEEGQRLAQGQLAVRLECDEQKAALTAARAKLSMAREQAAAAQSSVKAAFGSAAAAAAGVRASGAQSEAVIASRNATERQVQRLKRLRGEGGATEAEMDQATTQVSRLNEQLESLRAQTQVARRKAAAARAQVDSAKQQAEAAVAAVTAAQADVERAQTLVRECGLRSPVAGVVQTRALEPGEVVLPGTRVLTVVKLDPVETVFYLPNRDLAAAVPGREVRVTADPYPGRTFTGRILSIAPEAEFTPRNIQTREDRDRLVYAVRVRIPNPEELLRPGMPVEVRIPPAAGATGGNASTGGDR
jgi:HlyD family secretion protein